MCVTVVNDETSTDTSSERCNDFITYSILIPLLMDGCYDIVYSLKRSRFTIFVSYPIGSSSGNRDHYY